MRLRWNGQPAPVILDMVLAMLRGSLERVTSLTIRRVTVRIESTVGTWEAVMEEDA